MHIFLAPLISVSVEFCSAAPNTLQATRSFERPERNSNGKIFRRPNHRYCWGSSPAVPKIFGCKTWREGLETNGNLKSCVVRPQVDFVRWYYRLFMATHREGASLLCGCCVAGGLLLGPEASKSFSEDRAACPRGAWGADRSVGAF